VSQLLSRNWNKLSTRVQLVLVAKQRVDPTSCRSRG